MLSLRGAPAHSDARRRRLLSTLRASDPGLRDLETTSIFFIEVERPLSAKEQIVLDALLRDGIDGGTGGEANSTPEADVLELIVVPRFGTISPWSSKATEIVLNCGLDAVKRVERGTVYRLIGAGASDTGGAFSAQIHDRMTETVILAEKEAEALFARAEPAPFQTVDVLERGADAIREADQKLGLALAADEVDYLVDSFRELQRDPTDVELMMFAQANSEHCRHKIFNASWDIDGEAQDKRIGRAHV